MFQLITVSVGGVASEPKLIDDLERVVVVLEKLYGPKIFRDSHLADKLKTFMEDDGLKTIDFFTADEFSFRHKVVLTYIPRED